MERKHVLTSHAALKHYITKPRSRRIHRFVQRVASPSLHEQYIQLIHCVTSQHSFCMYVSHSKWRHKTERLITSQCARIIAKKIDNNLSCSDDEFEKSTAAALKCQVKWLEAAAAAVTHRSRRSSSKPCHYRRGSESPRDAWLQPRWSTARVRCVAACLAPGCNVAKQLTAAAAAVTLSFNRWDRAVTAE